MPCAITDNEHNSQPAVSRRVQILNIRATAVSRAVPDTEHKRQPAVSCGVTDSGHKSHRSVVGSTR